MKTSHVDLSWQSFPDPAHKNWFTVSKGNPLKVYMIVTSSDQTFTFRGPGAHSFKALETYRTCKDIFSSSVFKNGEVYMPENRNFLYEKKFSSC